MSEFANALQNGHPNARRGWTLPMIGAVGLALLLGGCGKTETKTIQEEAAMAQRLQRVGTVELQVATGGGEPKTGEQAYQAQCAACHAAGALGAPKFGDAAAWAPRSGPAGTVRSPRSQRSERAISSFMISLVPP